MNQIKFEFKCNFNRVKLHSWIDKVRNPDGSYQLIGMCSCTEYDSETGVIISTNVEPTGLTGWAPPVAFDEKRTLKHFFYALLSKVRK